MEAWCSLMSRKALEALHWRHLALALGRLGLWSPAIHGAQVCAEFATVLSDGEPCADDGPECASGTCAPEPGAGLEAPRRCARST